MNTSPKPQRQNNEERKQQLLEIALDLFSVNGYDGTTTKAIALKAGVTEALVFHHFNSKIDLFHQVLKEYGIQRMHVTQVLNWDALPFDELIETLLVTYLDTLWKNRSAVKLMVDASLHDPVALNDLKSLDERPRQRLKMLLMFGASKGEISPLNTDVSADIIAASLGGFFFKRLRAEPDNWELERSEFVHHLIQLLLPGLKSGPM